MISCYTANFYSHLYKNKVIFITIIIVLLFILIKQKFNTESLDDNKINDTYNTNNTNSTMYIPNCNFCTDTKVCEETRGCMLVNDKCYYDWINLQ